MKKLFAVLLCLLSLLSFSACAEEEIPEPEEQVVFTDNTVIVTAPKTALNYLTGEYNMAEDRAGQRPYCVNVNNIIDSLPQSGLSQADIIVEVEAEDGVTRMGAVYTDVREVPRIGSLRSLRHQFIEAVYPFDPIFVCQGFGPNLTEDFFIENNVNVLDAEILTDLFYIDEERTKTHANWHCSFTNGRRIYESTETEIVTTASKSKYDSYFNFVEPGAYAKLNGGNATEISLPLSGNPYYDSRYTYDAVTGKYLRYQYDSQSLDHGIGYNTPVPLTFENVVILYGTIVNSHEEYYYALVDYQAGGTGYYFSGGKYETLNWAKDSFESHFVFTRQDGSLLEFNTGKTIMCVVNHIFEEDMVIS